ncbi:MAG: amidohydrolase family protein [Dehalococcoidia bacterium]|nr:MAG: amidohydrolase family protein [Dehalococcoidia bacterium]
MPALLINDVTLLDATGRDPAPHSSVLCESGRIARIGAAGSIAAADGGRVVDGGGRTLMPGLTDAHVHFGITAHSDNDPPESLLSYALKVIDNIRIALDEGFTTVRDAGRLDTAFAAAVESGEIAGPRILPSGSFLSQTGGHGDQRSRWSDDAPAIVPGLIAQTEICDGVDAVRRAARTQIRRGATQVKLMASGGIMSPSDPIDSQQFSVEEMAAAVREAHAYGRYVMAHCYTAEAMTNALDAGVRSLEHGSFMTEAVARRMVEAEAYLVPTVVIMEILARASGIPEFSRKKLDRVRAALADAVAIARAAGVRIGSGSDLLGPRQRRRASEIAELAKHIGAMEAIVAATRTNAELFRMEDRIGTVEEGKDADLILVNGNPADDPGVLVQAANIQLVVKGGVVMKDVLASR